MIQKLTRNRFIDKNSIELTKTDLQKTIILYNDQLLNLSRTIEFKSNVTTNIKPRFKGFNDTVNKQDVFANPFSTLGKNII